MLPTDTRVPWWRRFLNGIGVDDDGRIKLPLWMLLGLTAAAEAATDFLDAVEWRTVAQGLIVNLLGMFAAGKGVERAVQSYGNRAATWAGAVVAQHHQTTLDDVLASFRTTGQLPDGLDEPTTG